MEGSTTVQTGLINTFAGGQYKNTGLLQPNGIEIMKSANPAEEMDSSNQFTDGKIREAKISAH